MSASDGFGPLYAVLVMQAHVAGQEYEEFTDGAFDDAYVRAFDHASRRVRELGGTLVPLRDEAPDSVFAVVRRDTWEFDGGDWTVTVRRWR